MYRSFSISVVSFFCFVGMIISPASAYLDPGTGSMLVQALIAVLMGLGLTIKIYWQRIKDYIHNRI